MELFEAIARRHSYRGPFVARPLPRADLVRMVEAAMHAPSGYNAQTTSFVVVDDPAVLAPLRAMSPESQALRTAPAVIVCLSDMAAGNPSGLSFQDEDYGAAVENLLLAATALGYATVWLDGWMRAAGRAEAVAALLAVPADQRVRALLPVGVPAEERAQAPKKPFAERAWFNRFGAV